MAEQQQQQQQPPCRILVMASGNGSNFQALIDAVAAGHIPNSRITRLFVNRAKAYATTRADKAGMFFFCNFDENFTQRHRTRLTLVGIPWEYFNLISNGFLPKGEKDETRVAEARQKYDAALAQKVLAEEQRPELIVLAGWMHVFSGAFLEPLEKEGIKVINLHPALPGKSFFSSSFFCRHTDDILNKAQGPLTGLVPSRELTVNSRLGD